MRSQNLVQWLALPLKAKDAKGQPIKGANVRVESRDGKQLFTTVKTDAKGRYISQGLRPGGYRVSLVLNGAAQKTGKHLVWIPPSTGSHTGGPLCGS